MPPQMELTRQGSAEYTRQLSDEARQQRESLERESAGERALEKQLDEELLRVKQQLALHEAGSRIDAPQPEPEPAGMPSEGVPAQRPYTAPAGAASGASEVCEAGGTAAADSKAALDRTGIPRSISPPSSDVHGELIYLLHSAALPQIIFLESPSD